MSSIENLSAAEDLADRIAMSHFGSMGSTMSHLFLQDRLIKPIRNMNELRFFARRPARIFLPPNNEDRVVMFVDNSGVYVHSDGFCTPMGSDISHEIHQWEELV